MLLVGNGRLITWDAANPYLADGCVAIEDNLIKEVGPTEQIKAKYPEARFIDAKGRIIMPGLINAHMHYYSTFARGMSTDSPPSKTFLDILEGLWWRLDKKLTLEDVYYSALVPMIDCVKNGVTTVIDHHASPYAIRGSLHKIAEAARLIGLRSSLCYEVSDRDGKERALEGIEENAEFIKYCNSANDDMLKGMFGLHASLTLSNETLEKCCEANADSGVGFHVHTAEGPEDVEDSLKKYGKRVVERLADFGILGPKSLMIHCVHVNEHEIDLLKSTSSNVVHNPESNMGNAVGAAPVLEMMSKGVVVGLGTDGYTADMFESLKVANILHKLAKRDPSVSWAEPITMLFENNANIASSFFNKTVGRLVPGALADVIIVNYDPWTPMLADNLGSHIHFGMMGRSVDTTIINGKVVMEERQLVNIDEREILAKSRELANKLWQRI